MQKKSLFIRLIALLLPLTLSFSPSLASSPLPTGGSSPSPLASPADINTVTENIKARLKDTLAAPDSAIGGPVHRGYVGQVRDVIKDTIVMEDKDGKKNIHITDATTLVRSPGNSVIQLDDVGIEDYIIAIGDTLGDDELTGIRLIVSATPLLATNKATGLSTITQVAKSNLTLADDKTLIVNSKTVIKSTASNSLELADLAVGDVLVYTAIVDDDTTTATNLMRIKQASPTPTPSPKPTASPKPTTSPKSSPTN